MKAIAEIRERPILFAGPMVRAILDGRKTQTRRVVTREPALEWLAPGMFTPEYVASPENGLSPYGFAGDRLWVREAFSFRDYGPIGVPDLDRGECWFWADGSEPTHGNWTRPKPSIHMPRATCRIELEIVSVRIERLQEISEEDAKAEGVERGVCTHPDCSPGSCASSSYVAAFAGCWDTINGKRAPWYSNPWCWVVEFRRTKP